MGFHKRFLPELDVLKKMRAEINDDKKFIKSVIGKADCYVGSSGASQYIDDVIKKIENENNG
jgi:hypothetical protein